MDFPIFKTKIDGLTDEFDLNSPEGRGKYFEAKAGEEIEKLTQYLKKDAFIAYMLAKKSAGKGTYARMMMEIFGPEYVVHLSVGDIIRDIDKEINDPQKRKELEEFLKTNYRGFHSLEEIFKAQEDRSTKTLMPTEFILALVEREIARLPKKAIFIDGFPRGLDQVSYSLFFRSLVGYREDKDMFILIQIPETVIDERMKFRVICPKCHTPRNLKLLPTKFVGHDADTGQFFLMCDSPECNKARMKPKEGDGLGIENIRARLDKDEELLKKAFSLYGIPKVLLRNAVPVDRAEEMVDNYELTPSFLYSWDDENKRVVLREEPWAAKDDQGVLSYSLMAPAVVVSLLKQLVEVLEL